jgi:hypothetical protein
MLIITEADLLLAAALTANDSSWLRLSPVEWILDKSFNGKDIKNPFEIRELGFESAARACLQPLQLHTSLWTSSDTRQETEVSQCRIPSRVPLTACVN